jgi:hypothetical protein
LEQWQALHGIVFHEEFRALFEGAMSFGWNAELPDGNYIVRLLGLRPRMKRKAEARNKQPGYFHNFMARDIASLRDCHNFTDY